VRGVNARTSDCRAAREWASAQLDGELTGFELARLRGHLRSCPDCEAFVADIESIVATMRSAELAVPEHRVVVQRRIGPLRRMRLTAVAAAAAVAVGAFGLASSVSSTQGDLFARPSLDDPGLMLDRRRPSAGGGGQVLGNEVIAKQKASAPAAPAPVRLRRPIGPQVD
jgi:anti-sigma factor RsiW